MKKEINYTNLSLKTAVVSLIIMFVAMYFGSVTNDLHRGLVLGSYGVAALSLLYFFVSMIYHQLRDKRILWGIINVILLIFFLSLRSNESDYTMLPFIIVLISCLKYYFSYIKPKLIKKKKQK